MARIAAEGEDSAWILGLIIWIVTVGCAAPKPRRAAEQYLCIDFVPDWEIDPNTGTLQGTCTCRLTNLGDKPVRLRLYCYGNNPVVGSGSNFAFDVASAAGNKIGYLTFGHGMLGMLLNFRFKTYTLQPLQSVRLTLWMREHIFSLDGNGPFFVRLVLSPKRFIRFGDHGPIIGEDSIVSAWKVLLFRDNRLIVVDTTHSPETWLRNYGFAGLQSEYIPAVRRGK